jgi:preprotein translocase subunit SecF
MAGGFKRVMRGESRIDFVGRSKLWATISGIVLIGSTIALFAPGITLGLEFEGGTVLSVPVIGDEVTVVQVEDALAELEVADPQVKLLRPTTCEDHTASGDCQTIEVRSETLDPTDQRPITELLAELAAQPNTAQVNSQSVSASWGKQVSTKALRSLIVFLVLVTIYISVRFEWKMAAGAIAALIHDLLATAGIYALTGLTVSPATVIALLTLMGFSLYDTVVVFDRIKENADTMSPRERYADMVNRSMNEVLVRSINTSVSSILPVAGLLFVGVFLFNAETLKDLAVAMFIGTAVSIYSSIFVASPILSALKEREPRYKTLRARAPAMASTRGADPVEPELDTPPMTHPDATPSPPPPSKTPTGRPIRPRRKGRR